ncbi:carotenoid oxygenase family protein [Spiractinospora alimapuensis]|uniref:carotenoid oxygenase family protein n=1 Tax=Spiractinospora alimapuensis TaxID=2820884 RepID=UPI001F1B7D06|nr:carotenoid oxygenase family protein [Spiractinospora alimapuensis]QVQ52327.1 carotenoid oxygenase family protein [Spiractinospora alimapuensis]
MQPQSVPDPRSGARENRYLEGVFAPVTEEVTAYDLPVTGRIPRELSGRYLRIGPNPLGIDDPAAHIWAAGTGMVHGVRIRDGRAEWYRNRWVRDSNMLDALGEPRRPNSLEPWMDFAPNVNVISHAGRIFALAEAGALPYELSDELDTVGHCDLGLTAEGFSANAHSKFDARTGELHSLAYIPGKAYAEHIVTDATGVVVRVTRIPTASDTPYMHDFALTENHVILYDTPLVYSNEAMAAGARPDKALQWDHDHPGRVGVMPRSGGAVRWLESTPAHISHTLNAHDDGSSVVVDLITTDAPADPADPGSAPPTLDRWTLDLAGDRLSRQRIDDRPQDFPRVNESKVSRPYRYGYSAVSALYDLPFPVDGQHPDETFSNALVKHDLLRGTTEVHGFAADAAVGEAVFAAAPGGHEEDDGYLMAYVHNPDRGAADLVIVASQDFASAPVARVHLPVRVPLGLHGNWVPDPE